MTDHCITLNNGVAMPLLGLGVFRTNTPREMADAIGWAWEAGYRSFDTAQMYGNEGLLGNAIHQLGLPREEIFLTSKINLGNMGQQRTLSSFQKSLEQLRTDYLDLVLIHWPGQRPQRLVETWQTLEELYAAGHVRAIGVSNCLPRHLEMLLERCSVVPAVNQVERNPLSSANHILSWCHSRGIHLEAWSPLCKGNLDLEPIRCLAEKYGRTPAQIILRWDIQRQVVAIPKSVHRARIFENAAIFDFALEDADMTLIDQMDIGRHSSHDPETFDFDEEGNFL